MDTAPVAPARPPLAARFSGWWPSVAAASLLLLHAELAWLGRAPGVEASQDDARYILLGRALRRLSYSNVWLNDPTPHALYPPGYPALIATLGWVFHDAATWLILLNIAASSAALALIFVVLRRIWSPAGALAVLAALATNPLLNERAGLIVSEPVAMAAWMLSLALTLGPERQHRLAAGVAGLFAACTRAFAIGVPIAVALHWLLQRRVRGAVALGTVALAGVCCWIAWTAHAGTAVRNVSYVAEVAHANRRESPIIAVAIRAATNVAYYAGRDIPSGVALPGVPGTLADNVVNALIVVLGLGTGTVALYRRWRPAALTLVFGLVILAIWPWLEVRYLAPMMPVLVATLLMGTEAGIAWRHPRLAPPAVIVLALLLAASGLWHTVPRVASRTACDRTTEIPSPTCEPARLHGFFAAIGWLKNQAPAGATVLAAKSATVHYYTALPLTDYGRALLVRPEEFGAYVSRERIRFAILSGSHSSEPKRLARRLEAMCAHLRTAAAFPPNGYVFEIVTDSAAPGGCDDVREYQRWSDATARPDGNF